MIDPETARAIDAALMANDVAGAALLAERAIAAGARTPMLLNLVAWAREEAGDFAGAHALLEQALVLAPGDPLIFAAMGSALRKQGRLAEAIAAVDRALAIDPRLPSAWLDRGYALEAAGSIALAEAAFRQSATLDRSAAAWAGVASTAARGGRVEAARDAADRAIAAHPRLPAAIIALARVEIEERRWDEAADRLDALLATSLPAGDRQLAETLLGDAFDRLDRIDEAHAAYVRANAAFAEAHGEASPHESFRAFVERIDRAITAIEPAPRYEGTQPARHVFLLGFPRSGTTLVENILASLPDAAALEEQPTLGLADQAFLLPADGLDRLRRADAVPFQRDYWNRVAAAGIDPAIDLFVDMDPVKGLRLPLIARLFPDARVVVMRRDPRDVVWSCFRTGFAPSGAATEFVSLERAARLYDAMMRLTNHALATLPIDAHILRYDALVEDFDATTRSLCDFIGIAWTEDLRRFDRTAERRGVATASVGQVRRGLYDGRHQWRRYQDYMAPVLPILQPWIDWFGME
jgi:tetratricopeptide (TPR) repeat protein